MARNSGRGSIRIIAGRWRGRRIDIADISNLRPTPNRVRETLFNWLALEIEGARCLDLFAGSGALGLEALSRGAASVTFVDSHKLIVRSLRAQLEQLDASATLVCAPADDYLATSSEMFDVIFADPPFAHAAQPVCNSAALHLGDGGALYCERNAEDELPELDWGHWQRRSRAAGVRFGLARAGAPD